MVEKPEVLIRYDLKPGDLGYIIYLHGHLYAKEYDFNIDFETYVAGPLTELVQRKSDRERVWVVELAGEGEIVGSIAVSEYSDEQAQLRWLLLHPRVRGNGFGKKLIEEAMGFCRNRGYSTIFLWTVDVCREAGELYKKLGFRITEEKPNEIWDEKLTDQKYERGL
ncbi:MAG: GNAT family N-acetyltransferase [Thermoplasmata archaeon]|nr:MAG: GNAT family N-acetyltransferase [Thermoplasmata archaeon]